MGFMKDLFGKFGKKKGENPQEEEKPKPKLEPKADDIAKRLAARTEEVTQKDVGDRVYGARSQVSITDHALLNRLNDQLFDAVMVGNLEKVNEALEDGANADARDHNEGWTPLFYAVWKNKPEIANALIVAGADVNATSGKGQTPLKIAKERNRKEMEEMLVKFGAVNDDAKEGGKP